ncbi:hypothetical protein ACHQM5_011322 [Ranunculus cassubicifolius]
MQLANVQQWLPPGWAVEIRESPSGRRDKYYISPNGIRFDSRVKVCRFLGMEEECIVSERRSNVIKVARKEELGQSMDWLPPNWEVEFTKRKDGRIDKNYIDPVTGHKFRSTKEVSRYLQFGEIRGGRRVKEKFLNYVDSSDQEFTLSSRAKIRKLAWKSKRRSLFTGQSSNKNNQLVLKSTEAESWEEEECYNDRQTLFHPSVVNDLDGSLKHNACTTVTCAVPLSSLYPEMGQPSTGTRVKRKTKIRSGKAQSRKEPVRKKPKPNPPYPKPIKERVIPSRASRRIAGLKPELSSESLNRSQDVPMEASTEVDTVPSAVVHELGMVIHDVHKKPSQYEEEEIVSSADIESSGFDEHEVIASIMKKKKKRVSKKKHTVEDPQILKNYLQDDDEEEEIVPCASTKPLRHEKQKPVIFSKKKRKYIGSQKRKEKARKGQAPRASDKSSKVKASMPELMEATVKWLGGKYIEWIYEKEITTTDVNRNQARLYLPIEIENFLSETEKKYLKEKPKNGLEVVLVDHKSETWDMLVKYWPSVENYILVKNWPQFIEANGIEAGKHVVDMWTFRQCLSQEEQVEDGNKKKGKLGFALNLQRNELGETSEDEGDPFLEENMESLEFEKSVPETTCCNQDFSVVTRSELDNRDVPLEAVAKADSGEHSHFVGIKEKTNGVGKTQEEQGYRSELEIAPDTRRGNQDVRVDASVHSLGIEEEDPWKRHAEEYTRKVGSKRSGTILTLPSCESSLDPCIEFAYKTLTGLIPMEHLPVNLMRE